MIYPFLTHLISYVMHSDINSRGEIIEEDRPSGADSEHRQPAKTINADGQKKKRDEKRRRKLVLKHNKATVSFPKLLPTEF